MRLGGLSERLVGEQSPQEGEQRTTLGLQRTVQLALLAVMGL